MEFAYYQPSLKNVWWVERQRSFVCTDICRTICFLDPTATIYSYVQCADEGCS